MMRPELKAALDALAATKGLRPVDEILASEKSRPLQQPEAIRRPEKWRPKTRTTFTQQEPWWADGK